MSMMAEQFLPIEDPFCDSFEPLLRFDEAKSPHPSEVPFCRLASNRLTGTQEDVLQILQSFHSYLENNSLFEQAHPAFDLPIVPGHRMCKNNLAHISIPQILSGGWALAEPVDEESGGEDDFCSDYMSSVPHNPGDRIQTTLMVRNIPLMYTQEMLMREWPNHGTYDFLYLPCVTYAFVNFTSPCAALEFMTRWQQARLHRGKSKRALNISVATVQGLANNLKRWKKKRTWRFNHRCKPFVFQDGFQVSLEDLMYTMSIAC
mmetsp:Transcript_118605/g.185175  ORF Transcript_118605/g.185175 Transcript_118605/m.185175 type:complete len:261 (-) Transcript_118605:165-947(-)